MTGTNIAFLVCGFVLGGFLGTVIMAALMLAQNYDRGDH